MKIPVLYQIECLIRNIRDGAFSKGRKKSSKIISDGQNNKIEIDSTYDQKLLRVSVIGDNNTVSIGKLAVHPLNAGTISIRIFGNNCNVTIKDGFQVSDSLEIQLGKNYPNYGKVDSANLFIGTNTSAESCKILTYHSNNTISIGDNCMISANVQIINTDSHPIFDKNDNRLINFPGDLSIGNKCWLGLNATILKNVSIPDNCIVGMNATVAKKFDKPNCAIAGNPARVVKEDIYWEPSDPRFVSNK